MLNLLNSGLSTALLAADSSAKSAEKPMNMISREMMKDDPNLGVIERAGNYGSQHLNKANESIEQAKKELLAAQTAAKKEEKAEKKADLEKKSAESVKKPDKIEISDKGLSNNEISNRNEDPKYLNSIQPEKDMVEISQEVIRPQAIESIQLDNDEVVYTAKAAVAKSAPVKPQFDTKA